MLSAAELYNRVRVATCLQALLAALAFQSETAATVFAQSPKTTGDWTRATPSPIERVEAPTLVVKNQIYIFGGFDK